MKSRAENLSSRLCGAVCAYHVCLPRVYGVVNRKMWLIDCLYMHVYKLFHVCLSILTGCPEHGLLLPLPPDQRHHLLLCLWELAAHGAAGEGLTPTLSFTLLFTFLTSLPYLLYTFSSLRLTFYISSLHPVPT